MGTLPVIQLLLVALCSQGVVGARPLFVPQICKDAGIELQRPDAWYPFDDSSVRQLRKLNQSISDMQDLLDSGCSDILGRFLCTAQLPQLSLIRKAIGEGDVYLGPCAEVCRDIWRECRNNARQLEIERTPVFDCSKKYPSKRKADCLSHLIPPRDAPLIDRTLRNSNEKVTIFFTPPDSESFTQAFLVRFNETSSPVEKSHIHVLRPKQDGAATHQMIIDTLESSEDYFFKITALNDFGEGPTIQHYIPPYNDLSCEEISVPECPDLTRTALPVQQNLAQVKIQDAWLTIQTFAPLVSYGCNENLQWLVCATHFPACTDDATAILPCREVCEEVRSDCASALEEFGFPWPESLDCQRYPARHTGQCQQRPGMAEAVTDEERCEDITIPLCKSGSDYNQTAMPNFLRHLSQDDAGLEIHQFFPLVKVECSPYLRPFLCAMYTPRCDGSSQPLLPCQELCNAARRGCRPLMKKFGFSWPESLACENLPRLSAGQSCETAGMAEPVTEDQCEDITIPLCKSGVDYNQTAMPNFLRHLRQDDAGLEVHQFFPLVKVECSPYLRPFLCAMYTPRCDGSSQPLLPCQELCDAARRGCRPLMKKFGFSWPESLACENLPRLSAGQSCESAGMADPVTEEQCEDITVPMCKFGLDYNQTAMPNFLNHSSQDEVGLEIHQFFPLVKVDCSPYLRSFLCAMYTPRCDGSSQPLLPCQELCDAARRGCSSHMEEFGFSWPEALACENLPRLNRRQSCETAGLAGTLLMSARWCEDITVPMCQSGIGYNQTIIPSPRGYRSQARAAREVQQFMPFVEMGCSKYLRTFLCALYTPSCDPSTPVPCKEMCEHARTGCEGYMNTFGFSWSDSLPSCDAFPSHNAGGRCYYEDDPVDDGNSQTRCENITVSLCETGIGYGQTVMPNFLGHDSQEEARSEVYQFWPLVQVDCSPYFRSFLCALYIPRCTPTGPTLPPCRELCETAKSGCSRRMWAFGFFWPESLKCEKFPSHGAGQACYPGVNIVKIGPQKTYDSGTVEVECTSDVHQNNALPTWSTDLFVITTNPRYRAHAVAVNEHTSKLVIYDFSNHRDAGWYNCSLNSVTKQIYLFDHNQVNFTDVTTVWSNQTSGQLFNQTRRQLFNQTCGQPFNQTGVVKPRRYDISDLGEASLFRGWVDVQGQGAANDYCRVVTDSTGRHFFSCALAGMQGSDEFNYNSLEPWFDAGHMDTWYMRDVNGDGRDDYCRCVGCIPKTYVSCLLADQDGFSGSMLDYPRVEGGCHYTRVNPFFGPL